MAIESWLRQLRGANGEILANATKAKIRNIFSVIFNHAIRSEWLPQGKNPVTLVRQSARRRTDPPVLDYREIQALLNQLCESTRLIVMLAVTTGLRRSELFALKWCDIDFVGIDDFRSKIRLFGNDRKLHDGGFTGDRCQSSLVSLRTFGSRRKRANTTAQTTGFSQASQRKAAIRFGQDCSRR